MRSLLGAEYQNYIASFDFPPFRGIRLNTLKCTQENLQSSLDFELEPTPFCPQGFYLPPQVRGVGTHPMHCAGAFYVQEPSAMAAVEMLAPQTGDYVLDLCSAPGGKATQIASALKDGGILWANEVVPSRAQALLSNIERLGVKNAVVSCCSPDTLCSYLPDFFDKILVDAPCSGEGMFRRNIHARRGWSPKNVLSCAERQLEILQTAKLALKNGGVMVYSTCTFSQEENEGVVSRFLQLNPDFTLEDAHVSFGRSSSLKYARRAFPSDGGEGFFAARLRRSGQSSPHPPGMGKSHRIIGSDVWGMYDAVFKNRPFGENIRFSGDKVLVVPPNFPEIIAPGILRAGVLLGRLCQNRVEPAHAAFMASKPEECASVLDFDCSSKELSSFLHGEQISAQNSPRGYTAVSVNGVVCGFGKASNGVLKNRYPKGLRLLQG